MRRGPIRGKIKTALEIVDCYRRPTDDEKSAVGLAKPVVQGRDSDSEPLCRFRG